MTIATQIPSDRELLARYAASRSDADFRHLAERHLDWIYSVALRRTRKTALAEDVTQAVLLSLSQKAATLQSHPSPSSWLFRATQYAASNLLRAERRRHHYEREAMPTTPETTDPQLLEKLDRAMNRLGTSEREALLLRFYQRLPHAAVATELRISEDAARQRINRAIEKLRKLLGAKSATTLTAALTGSLIITAPRHLLALSTTPHVAAASSAIHTSVALAKLKWIAVLLALFLPLAIATALITARSFPAKAPIAAPTASPSETTPPTPDYSSIKSYRVTAYQEATPGHPEHLTGQSWLDLDHGTLDTHIFTDVTYIARDDGQHAYKFRSNSPYIVQKNTDQPAPLRKRLMTMVLDFYRSQLTQRHPEMDLSVNSEKLACWQSDELAPPFPGRIDQNTLYIWLDPHGLPRRTETTTVNTLFGTTTRTRTEIDYNLSALPETWAIPADKQIVDPVQLLEKQYPLATALFTYPAAGQIFAFHQLAKAPDGTLFLIISTRATDETRAKFRQVLDHSSLSLFTSAGEGTRTIPLASIEAAGIHVKYLAVVPAGATTPSLTAELDTIEPDPQSPGKTDSFPLSLPATAAPSTVEAFASQTYNAVHTVDGITTADLRIAQRNKKHRWSGVQKSVSELSREDFIKQTTTRLQDPTAP